MLKDPKNVKVFIVSCNPFVSDFLWGLVEAHGYSTEAVSDLHKAQVRMKTDRPYVVFVDDSCLELENIKNFELRTQHWTQEGVPVVLLANKHTKHQVEGLPACKFFQIVEKPVGYLQMSHVMADLTNA